MKLIRTIDNKMSLLVLLPNGPHVLDVRSSLGVFAPHDPLASGLLNGALKDGCDWSLIVRHWAYLSAPLRKLASIAKMCPDHPLLNIRPFTEQLQLRSGIDQIVALDIVEAERLGARDPADARTIDRQFGEPSGAQTESTPAPARTAQIINFLHHAKIGVPRP